MSNDLIEAKKVKTSDLSGIALDWAVSKCEGLPAVHNPEKFLQRYLNNWQFCRFSGNWGMGGEIIQSERISVVDQGGDYWRALHGWQESVGETPLIAAMRVYVAFKLGDEVDVPEELL